MGLAWQLAHYDKTLLISGTSSPRHLAENLAVGDLALPPAARMSLDRLAAARGTPLPAGQGHDGGRE